jgi:uncharacterized protein YjbJ (UPF0337 family)
MAIRDKIDQATGRAKQAAGDLTDDEQMRAEGENTEAKGKLKEKVNDVKDRIDHAIDVTEAKINSGGKRDDT